MSDFSEFLRANWQRKVGKEPVFLPGRFPEDGRAQETYHKPRPLSEGELAEAEQKHGVRFGQGYREFMLTAGPGIWCDAILLHPLDIRTHDDDESGLRDLWFVGVNVDYGGNYAALDPDGMDRVIFCCHDPYSFAVAGETFEQYIRSLTEAYLSSEIASFYSNLVPFWSEEFNRKETGKPWWKFWA